MRAADTIPAGTLGRFGWMPVYSLSGDSTSIHISLQMYTFLHAAMRSVCTGRGKEMSVYDQLCMKMAWSTRWVCPHPVAYSLALYSQPSMDRPRILRTSRGEGVSLKTARRSTLHFGLLARVCTYMIHPQLTRGGEGALVVVAHLLCLPLHPAGAGFGCLGGWGMIQLVLGRKMPPGLSVLSGSLSTRFASCIPTFAQVTRAERVGVRRRPVGMCVRVLLLRVLLLLLWIVAFVGILALCWILFSSPFPS